MNPVHVVIGAVVLLAIVILGAAIFGAAERSDGRDR
jgi:hypothetical protein